MEWDELVQDPLFIAIAAAVVIAIIAVIVIVVLVRRRRRRREMLQRRFGSEYERTVREGSSRRSAEDELDDRRLRRERLEVRPLTMDERDRFRGRYEEIQASFVDAPGSAVQSARALLDEVAEARGYREVDGSDLMSIVSVDHPDEVAGLHDKPSRPGGDGQPVTEDLRQALLSTRRLLDRLITDGEVADASTTPAPPRSLLGLGEDDDDDGPRTDDHPADGRPQERSRVEETDERSVDGSAAETERTLSTRTDDGRQPAETVDLTAEERSRERR